MHHPHFPLDWRDAAATYDPRSLPFLRYYAEAGLIKQERAPVQTLAQSQAPSHAARR